jgi:hypothetical protein
MLDLNKHLSFFNPTKVDVPVHVIGIGAMGSRILEQLVRLGVTNIHIYDFDTVESANVANQLYTNEDIGMTKTEAIVRHMNRINIDAIVKVHDKGYINQPLRGYVFLCVDSIELRQKIVKDNLYNLNILAMFDTRMRLTDAQSYGADWSKEKDRNGFLASMSFSDAEAKEATPVSACGTTLSVCPTVIMCASLTVANFMNFVNIESIKNIILLDAFQPIANGF